MAEVYINSEGIEEKPKQYYFFMQYQKLPRLKRSIHNLYDMLKDMEAEGLNEYKTPSLKTLYNYSNRFEWDKRLLSNLYEHGEDFIIERIDDDIYEYRKAQTALNRMFDQLEGMDKLLDWANVDCDDYERINSMCKLQKVHNDTMLLVIDVNMGLTEMITSATLLQEIYKDNEPKALPFEELLSPEYRD